MDDLISRKAVMKEFSDFVRKSNNSDFAKTPNWNDAVSLVGSMPSSQPDITKCGECRHAKELGCALFCEFWGKYTPHSGYCFKAERRKG